MADLQWRALARCRACWASPESFESVFEMDSMPLAGAFATSQREALEAPTLPLSWVRCTNCLTVQVKEDVSDEVLYTSYSYASSTVAGLVRHFDTYADWLTSRYQFPDLTCLEIGCNDGILLKRLPSSWRLIGVDPSDIARSRREGGYRLINEPMSRTVVTESELSESVDLVTASNCLAHSSDIREVLLAANACLRFGGDLVIEVHDLAETLRRGQWDTIYHEHKVEWSREALARAVGLAGFEEVESFSIPIHGGSLRSVFRKVGPPCSQSSEPMGGLASHYESALLHQFAARYRDRRLTPTYRALVRELGRSRSVWAYGAAGRATVWLNQMSELKIQAVVDESPLRIGKWVPGVGIEVVGPDSFRASEPNVCLITAWNYADDIIEKNPQFRGRWMYGL